MFVIDKKIFRQIDDLTAAFRGMEEKLPSVVARGMTFAANDAKEQIVGWLPRLLDRPTPWTMRSLFVFPAEKNDLRAAVAFKHEMGRLPRSAIGRVEASTSMRYQASGGRRPLKAAEKTLRANGITGDKPYLVPAKGAKLDRYGNVSGAFMNRVLFSGVARGSASQGYSAPMSGTARTKRGRKKADRFFVKHNAYGPVGIYENVGKGRSPMPVFIFVNRADYRSRVPFDQIARSTVERMLGQRLKESFDVVWAKYRLK